MSGRTLLIDWIQLRDKRGWQERYYLEGNLVGVVGSNDRGKTSAVQCIDYIFGSKTKFRGAVAEHMQAFRAQVRLGDRTFVLHRARRLSSTIRVLDVHGAEVGVYPVKSNGEQQTISDWLLERLGLDDDFAAVRLPNGKPLSFATDLLPYLHIRQEDIDRFIVRPADESGRLAVLNPLLQLRSPALERLTGTIADLKAEIRKLQTATKDVADFLARASDTNPEALRAELLRLQEEERETLIRARAVRDKINAAIAFADHLKEQVEQAHKRLSSARDAVDWTTDRHRQARNKVSALEDSLKALGAALAVGPQSDEACELHSTTCDACAGDLLGRVVPPGHCSSCLLALPVTAYEREVMHLQAAKRIADVEAQVTAEDLQRAREALKAAERDHAKTRKTLDDRTSTATTPFVDAQVAVSTDLALIKERIKQLHRLWVPHLQLAQQYDTISKKESELETKLVEQGRLVAELQKPDEVLERLDSLFREIVLAFELPWATGRARLDSKTLLPMVDEKEFDDRGNGSRTAISVAYSLALLMYALEEPERFNLPTLLILDAPQKNFGRNDLDQQLATRMYNWIVEHFGRHTKRYKNFQLIIVDNNIPTAVRGGFDKIVSFKDGFIRNLSHPHGAPVPSTDDHPNQ